MTVNRMDIPHHFATVAATRYEYRYNGAYQVPGTGTSHAGSGTNKLSLSPDCENFRFDMPAGVVGVAITWF